MIRRAQLGNSAAKHLDKRVIAGSLDSAISRCRFAVLRPKTHQWSIWWLDSRTPLGPLDPPMRGSFLNGVGTFYGDDTLDGKPVRARFLWSKITPTTCHWEQAYSPDEGKTWETNWVQDIERAR